MKIMNTMRGAHQWSIRVGVAAAILCATAPASSWVLSLGAGPKELFLGVGAATVASANGTVNLVSASVTAANVGSGTAVPMDSNSTQGASPFDGYAVCNPTTQVYVGGSYRQPDAVTGSAVATLQVSTPANLTSGSDSIPFSQIVWSSTANGNTFADIPASAFNGSTQTLATFGRNTYVENCFVFSYLNQLTVPAGTFTGRATFTLATP